MRVATQRAPRAAYGRTQEIGTAMVAAGAPITRDGARVGQVTVSRDGVAVVAVAHFKGQPAGKAVTLCVTTDGAEYCKARKAHRHGTVQPTTTAPDPLSPVCARAHSGRARGHVAL